VLASRAGEMETVSLSARPQVTYVRPWYNDPFWGDRVFPYMAVGHSQDLTIEGYMFTRTTNIYISAGSGVYTNTLSSISAFNLFSDTSPLTGKDFLSLYPSFSGRKVDSSSWHVENDNTIKITLEAPQGVGYIDLIIQSIAGYSLLSKDLSGGPIIVRT
jgi:hypothetical protein